MCDRLSNKFRWLSFIATWAVICIHSRTDRWVVGIDDFAIRLEQNIADVFHFAVPLFFVISGYMFVSSYLKHGWIGLIKRKFISLYVPMVLWSFIGVALCFPIRVYSGHNVPTFLEVCKLPFMVFRPEAIHFWYVRALIFLFLVAPLTMFITKRFCICILIMGGAMFVPIASVAQRLHIPVVVFFFFLGSLMAIKGPKVKLGSQLGLTLICFAGLILAFIFKTRISQHYFGILVEPLFMIGLLWFGYDVVDAKWRIARFPDGLNVLFFVYCIHLIIICWCGGIMQVVFGSSPVARLVGYFTLWLTFWVDVWIANRVRKLWPRVFTLLAGGRG